ncbi:hypothetical protein ACLUTX_22425 [Enterobacterales bacterium AE_CKDN230030158-1A_HGKHYDSX7]
MDAFAVRGGQPPAEDVPLSALAASYGTPNCATGEPFARQRSPVPEEGDLLAGRPVGAYGFVMNSNDNTRGRAAEVLVDSSAAHWVRRHGTRQELFAGESLLPD